MKNQKRSSKTMFRKLHDHIGEKVICNGWIRGNNFTKTDILSEIDDFLTIQLGWCNIPFIGYGTAISSITTTNGKVLYLNNTIPNNYDFVTDEDINICKKLIFKD